MVIRCARERAPLKRHYVHIWMYFAGKFLGSQKMAPARQKGSGGQARTLATPLIKVVVGYLNPVSLDHK